MKDRIKGPDVSVRFHLVDIRDLDGERLLASADIGDNVLAILTRLSEQPKAVRRILERIGAGQPEERDTALAELLILARLRRLSDEVIKEAGKMALSQEIMHNEVFAPLLRQGRAEGQLEMLLGMAEKRFGKIPPAVAQRIAALKPAQLKRAGLRLLDAQRIEDLFAR